MLLRSRWGPPPPADLTPPLLGASYYHEAGDVLGRLESIALTAYLVDTVASTALLAPEEAYALDCLEAFQRVELEAMHAALLSSELVFAASPGDMAGVEACSRAAEYGQRRRLMELFASLPAAGSWTLQREWEAIRQSRSTVFQAAAIFVSWVHQRFYLHYLTRTPQASVVSSPAQNDAIWPYTLRLFAPGSQQGLQRARLAGWRAESAGRQATGATLLCVPSLRNPHVMVEALKAARQAASGPFLRSPPLPRGVCVTELLFENV